MRIAEISTQEFRPPSEDPPSPPLRHQHLLSQIEALIKQAENHPPDKTIPESISSDLRQTLTQLTQLSFPTANNSLKLHLWKLSYRLWNACVDLSNAACIHSPPSNSAATSIAKLRHVAADILSLAVDVSGVPSPAIKCASFYHKTGVIWHDLRNFDLASTCFERATDLVAKLDIGKIADVGERKLLLDLNIARSRTAWEVSDRNLAINLLCRAKSFLLGSSSHYRALANQYLVFSKSVLARNDIHAFAEALKLMNEALDLCEKGLAAARTREETVEIRELRVKTLRFISAAHLQKGEYESVIKCVNVLRESGEGGDNHASLPVLAMKAWLGLRRFGEAEKELRDMAANKGVPEAVWVSAVEAYFQAAGTAGAETAKSVFLGLLERCHVSARSAVRVAHKVLGDGAGVDGSRVRAKVVADLVCDDRVVALFSDKAADKEREAMHAVLWNCASDHFQSKDYETSAALFEKSMLYMSDGVDKRVQRAKGFRVLCLCNLALSQLDQAQEYINEAEKLEPNIACAFLKFKIYLQKNELDGAIGQIQAMKACLDFTPEFLSLSAHEAIACHALPVAVASLSNFLNFYSPGKAMPTSEVIVLRTLITILSQDHGNEIEVLKYLKQVQVRLSELGAENFFGKEEVGKREWNWFAATSWNFGTKSGKEKRYDLCAEFFKLAAEFYGVKLGTEMEESNITMCRSLVLAVSAMIASENQKKTPLTDTEVKLAVEMLDKAGKIITSASTEMQSSGDELGFLEPDMLFIYTFTALDIQGRLTNAESQFLLVRNFASSKSCNPKYLLQIGLCASQGPRSNPQVATLALKEGLAAALSFPVPVYPDVAVIIRRLIAISSIHNGDTDDDAVLHMYKQAYRIMVGLKDGEYPTEEGKWLAMTAWNRAAVPLKLGQIEAANKWMKAGLELASMVAGMETYRACMEDYIAGIDKSLGVGVKIAGEGNSEQQAPVPHL